MGIELRSTSLFAHNIRCDMICSVAGAAYQRPRCGFLFRCQ